MLILSQAFITTDCSSDTEKYYRPPQQTSQTIALHTFSIEL